MLGGKCLIYANILSAFNSVQVCLVIVLSFLCKTLLQNIFNHLALNLNLFQLK